MLSCPACRSQLEPSALGPVPVHRCPRCPRLWLEKEALPALLAGVRRDFVPSQLAELRRACARRKQSAVQEAELFGSVEYFACPVCGQPMQRKSFARVSYVVVQACAPHGLLLTEDGLAQLTEFLAHGGEILVWEQLYRDLEEQLRQAQRETRGKRRPGAELRPDHPLSPEITALLALSEPARGEREM